jgi:hypothetical protein
MGEGQTGDSLMFATLTEKLIVAALTLILLGIGVFWLEHRGAERCVEGDKTIAADRAVKNAKVEAAGTIAGNTEDRNREEALARPVDPVPVISVQPAAHPACRNPAPADRSVAGAGAQAEPVRAAGAGGGVQAQDDAGDALWVKPVNEYIRSNVQLAKDADVELNDRNRLLVIRDAVCRGKGPPEP